MPRRVVVAMSGGVDSSVAAYLLHTQGHEVIGIGMRLPDGTYGIDPAGACCGIAGMDDARRVAEQIGIRFYVLNFERPFTQAVIDPFCHSYAAGHTPNPCVNCNTGVKFGPLLDTALALDADYLATGHYARVFCAGSRLILREAADLGQDQSYFLWGVPSHRLAHTLFPLGDLTKDRVREIASGAGLHVARKPGSQDICFLHGTQYQHFLERRVPEAFLSGPILDAEGHVLGTHSGYAGFTIGQRKGLGISASQPLYVQAIDPARNAVIVGPQAQQMESLHVTEVNWLAASLPSQGWSVLVRTRHRGPKVPCHITFDANWELNVRFAQPQPAVAPGQSAVFFLDDLVAGGGVIQSVAAPVSGA